MAEALKKQNHKTQLCLLHIKGHIETKSEEMAKDISKRKQEQLYLYQTNEWKILDPTLKLLELTNEFSKVSGDKFFFFFSLFLATP